MSDDQQKKMNEARRQFLKTAILASAALPVLAAFPGCTKKPKLHEGVKPLEPTDPAASALGYHKDASEVDSGKWPKFKEPPHQSCKGCNFYTAYEGTGFGKCTILPAGAVSENGWCNSWAPKSDV